MFLEGLLNDYFIFLFFLGFVVTLSFILFTLSYFLVADDVYFEKISAYECGFEPFEDTRVKFDVRFYLVGILFLVFDIEVMFVYPWVACFSLHTSLSFVTMFFFLLILVIGFVYEWQKGALDWS